MWSFMVAFRFSLCYNFSMRKSFIVFAALSVAPLCVAQHPEVVPMPAEMAAAVGLTQEEADIYSSLALLQQDTEAYLALGNLSGLASLSGLPEEALGEVSVVESAALGLGTGSANMLRQALPLYRVLAMADSLSELSSNWAAAAHEQAAAVIRTQGLQQLQEANDQMIDAVAAWRMAPAYAVVTVREEGREMLPSLQQGLLSELRAGEGAESVEQGDWHGARFRISENDIQELLAGADLTALQKVKLEGALSKLSLQVLVKVRDRSLVVAVCSDAADLSLAATPADSVLVTDKVAFLKQQNNPLVGSYLPAELNNACRELNLQATQSLAGFATGVFKTLSAESASDAGKYQNAVAAIATLLALTEKHSPAEDAPTTLLLWEDGNLHLDIVGDANGARFAAAESVALPMNDKTFFTFTCDPIQKATSCDAAVVLQVCETLANGVSATLNADAQMQTQMVMEQYHLFDPERETLGRALLTWKNAFTGRVAMVADAAGSVPASLFGGSPAQMVTVPRVAVAAGVAERADIEKGRALFMQAVEQGMSKMGMPKEQFGELPMAETTSGTATLYSLAMPMCCQGFSPTVAVSDKTWSLSSAAELAAALADGAISPAAGEGQATFSFIPQPVAELLESAAALDPQNADLAEAAEVAAAVSSAVSQMSGTITLSADDLMHLHVEVKLNH